MYVLMTCTYSTIYRKESSYLNQYQLRHAKAMARKIREHAERIVFTMSNIENLSRQDGADLPLNLVSSKFTHDAGYGVQDYTDAIESVIHEMLPELEQQ